MESKYKGIQSYIRGLRSAKGAAIVLTEIRKEESKGTLTEVETGKLITELAEKIEEL